MPERSGFIINQSEFSVSALRVFTAAASISVAAPGFTSAVS